MDRISVQLEKTGFVVQEAPLTIGTPHKRDVRLSRVAVYRRIYRRSTAIWMTTVWDCGEAREKILMFNLPGLKFHPKKVCWEGSRKLDYLGMHLGKVKVKVNVS